MRLSFVTNIERIKSWLRPVSAYAPFETLTLNLVGVPSVYYFGQEGLHNILCIDLLGPSLEDMFDLCSRKFSIKTTCMAAKQMVLKYGGLYIYYSCL